MASYVFKLAGEYFDPKGESTIITAGKFTSVEQAMRAAAWVVAYLDQPSPGKLPADLEELAVVIGSAETLEIGLYRVDRTSEEWIMSFDAASGRPIDMTIDAEVCWELMRKAL